MKHLLPLVGGFILVLGLTAQTPKPPDKLTFKSAMGNVTFDHAKHIERAKGDCKTCHEKLFKQSQAAPLNYKANMHKTAEASKTSCAGCHVVGGMSFESKSNCQKCHVKKG